MTPATEQTELKNIPITLPCGAKVKLGMKVFTVEKMQVYDTYDHSRNVETSVLKNSGKIRSYVVTNTVIAVNLASNVRSFTIRSDRGCEHTYTVKNTCVGHLYGNKAAAVKKQKEITLLDIRKIEESIRAKDLERNQKWKEKTAAISELRQVASKLRKAKY